MDKVLKLQNLELPEGPQKDGVADGYSSLSVAFCTSAYE
ncbi:SapB/AmfS family lanthipeptide [Streptomyces sp. NPDC092952]